MGNPLIPNLSLFLFFIDTAIVPCLPTGLAGESRLGLVFWEIFHTGCHTHCINRLSLAASCGSYSCVTVFQVNRSEKKR